MANTATLANLLTKVKALAGVTAVSNFDTDISSFIVDAIAQLNPRALNELTPDTSVTLAANTRNFTLPTGVVEIRALEFYDSTASADYYRPVDSSDFIQHGTQVWLEDPFPDRQSHQLRIFPLGEYVVHATDPTQTTLPNNLIIVVAYFALSLFYSELAGNASKYNAFIGTTGASKDHDMKDSADHYWNEADAMLDRYVAPRGQ